jgi:hypothetical protein
MESGPSSWEHKRISCSSDESRAAVVMMIKALRYQTPSLISILIWYGSIRGDLKNHSFLYVSSIVVYILSIVQDPRLDDVLHLSIR